MKHKIVFLIISFCFAIKIVAQNTVLDVTYHGAVGDGKTLNTECLQGVIDELHAHGGGQAYFPAGRYLTGSLQLKSGVTLYLERGAVLLGSTSPYDYPHVESQSDLKVNDDHFNQALIYADGAERIGINPLRASFGRKARTCAQCDGEEPVCGSAFRASGYRL